MLPAGTSLINTDYINGLASEIRSVDTCAALQAIVTKIIASIQAQLVALENQLVGLGPLGTIPHDLASVITWIENFANPMIRAYANCVATIVQVTQAVANLVTAIESAATNLVTLTCDLNAYCVQEQGRSWRRLPVHEDLRANR